MISQMITEIFDGKNQEGLESEKSLITRSLLLDFTEKSESPDSSECSSVLTCNGGESESKEKSSTEDDDASIWSIQVNASTRDDEEEEEEEEDDEGGIEEAGEEEEDNYDDYEGVEEEDDGLVDELCQGISKISVNGDRKMAKFTGKHMRFVYNSDDELEGEEECGGESGASSTVSPGIWRLKGLPTPKGKHIRFQEEMEEEEN
ncbi:hypothetical protein F0562_003657 [Nyssa sinensis]|uniref:Uncharacterized protein n=1 Tax=Nyssa sinensis TaxID=561372 RepID=A0A5J5BX10_9ASTE|nr:hypothetical protein F0562_003657 [Nyssa sinensis]